MLIAHLLLALQASTDLGAGIHIDREGLVIEHDTRVLSIATPLPDVGEDGALRITRPGVTVDLAGWELRGAAPETAADGYTGIGISIEARDVTLRGARVSGYRVGILARNADGLVLEDCDVSGNYRQRLRSTVASEAQEDWLWPHHNDGGEWRATYGAGICIERSSAVTVRRCRAREGQNGLILDRVLASTFHDNDFSFLSGWGIALWRSSGNRISRNALDFCVRGYSHGIYNRGQDSAGLLLFEQCSGNLVLENSITHGGDGVFGFAGKEALGEAASAEGLDLEGRGCNGNVFVGNDLSYAVAHGLELTFSFGNRVLRNRFVGNAICGIWGGYSQDMLVAGNEFIRNGDAGYGHERGGVNIEHGRGNRIRDNRFEENTCGVHLWWDDDAALLRGPWAAANGGDCADNWIRDNVFVRDALALHIERCSSTRSVGNRFEGVGARLDGEVRELSHAEALDAVLSEAPDADLAYEPIGETRPVGARVHLAGREHILIDEWGPYDGERPLLLRRGRRGDADLWRWLGPEGLEGLRAEGPVLLTVEPGEIRVSASEPDAIQSYALVATSSSGEQRRTGTVSSATWTVRAFESPLDPREDEVAWRAGAAGARAVELRELNLAYGSGGPGQLGVLSEDAALSDLPTDGFGTLAEARVKLDAGRWVLEVTSDDGVRVRMDGEVLFADWTHHGPRTERVAFELTSARRVHFEVEHFELDGYAILAVGLERAR